MPRQNLEEQLDEITFRCRSCALTWKTTSPRIEDAPEREWHPWRYFAPCPQCGDECEQAAWERNFLKMLAFPPDPRNQGPKTPEGRHACGANLRAIAADPERKARRSLRNRFNAMKHGLFAKVALYFPARPGKYPHCQGCPYFDDCDTGDNDACLRRTELFMLHRAAFQQRDPDALRDLHADNQAQIQAIFQDIVLAITRTGVELQTPEWYTDREGDLHWVERKNAAGDLEPIMKIEANPLIKAMFEIMAKNNMTLGDLRMTPKAQGEEEALQGFLDAKTGADDLSRFAERQTVALENLTELITRSRDKQRHDPVLIEHQREGDGE